jgi:hypothetical protein
MPLSEYYGGSKDKVMKNKKKDKDESKKHEKGESKKHEKSESKKKEKLEAGPSQSFKQKFGMM